MKVLNLRAAQQARLRVNGTHAAELLSAQACCSSSRAAVVTSAVPGFRNKQAGPAAPALGKAQARASRCITRAAVEAASALTSATRFLHFEETNDYSSLASVVTPDVKWRQRGLLQGSSTHRGIDAVREALKTLHSQYQDLAYRVNMASEEVDKVVLYWTATGVNRLPVHGLPASFRKSVFSGVSIVYLAPDGRVREVIEYRQPTQEEMHAFFQPSSSAAVKSLLDHGHLVPVEGSYPELGAMTVDQSWRSRAVAAATEWVENWTPGPDLEQLIREDFEEFNIYSWPDFEKDVAGQDAIEERCTRSAHDAVAILDTIADSSTNIIAVLWTDLQQVDSEEAQQMGGGSGISGAGAAPSSPMSGNSLPRRQPAVDADHGSVEMKDGHLRVHLSAPQPQRKTLSSIDEPGVSSKGLHKFSGVTLFKVDSDCKMAWSVTFRELTMAEKVKYLVPRLPKMP